MKHVLAVVDDAAGAAAVVGIAEAVAEVLHTDVQEIHLAVGSGAQDAAAGVLRELERTGTLLGVLADDASPGAMSWWIVRRSTKPVVLLPPLLKMPGGASQGRLPGAPAVGRLFRSRGRRHRDRGTVHPYRR